MNKCECDFCKENIAVYKEHEEIKCDFLKDSIIKSAHNDRLLSDLKKVPSFSYFIGAFWLNDKYNKEEYYTKSVIVKPKIENIDFMKMFSKCFEYSSIIKDFDEIYNINFEEKPIKYKDKELIKNSDLDILIAFHFLRTLEVELHNGLKRNFIRRE